MAGRWTPDCDLATMLHGCRRRQRTNRNASARFYARDACHGTDEEQHHMIIWHGRGGVTAIIIVLSILLVTAVVDKTSLGLPVWITYVAMAALAASANAIFAAKYAQPHTRVVID